VVVFAAHGDRNHTMDINPQTKRKLAVLGALALLAVPVVVATTDGASNAANKTSAAGSTVAFLDEGEGQEVLATTIKTSTTQDLIFSVTMECALWTTVTTVGNAVSEAHASVAVTVLFDGVPVPISGEGDDGSVVFCDRLHRQTTEDFDDEDARIQNYLATRTSNGFNWVLTDVGHGEHTIQVIADLVTSTEGDESVADAAVGHRTLVVETTQFANGFEL
jgi:hypothetical protein